MNKFASRIVLGARQLVAEVTASCAPWPMRDVRRFGQPVSPAVLLLLSLSLGAANLSATGYALSIRGTVSDTLFDGEVGQTRAGTFLVLMDADNWHIRYEREGDNFFYWESGQESDSELVFTFGMFDFEAMKRAASEVQGLPPTAKLAAEPAFQGVGYVEVGPVPRASGSTPAIPVLYYAFCSGSYRANSRAARPSPCVLLEPTDHGLGGVAGSVDRRPDPVGT
jgi:hypothetical protein